MQGGIKTPDSIKTMPRQSDPLRRQHRWSVSPERRHILTVLATRQHLTRTELLDQIVSRYIDQQCRNCPDGKTRALIQNLRRHEAQRLAELRKFAPPIEHKKGEQMLPPDSLAPGYRETTTEQVPCLGVVIHAD